MRLKFSDKVKALGRCRLTIRNLNDEILEKTGWTHNLVTDDGEELYAKLLRGDALDPCGYCAAGSGNTPAAEGDSTLETEIDRLEVTDTSIAGSVVTYSTFFGSGDANGTWWEVGMLNAAAAGVLIARTVLGASKNKSAANTITVDYELSVT